MAENSAISWTDHTMNFWIGCTKVSPACTNCYAAVDTFARRERSRGRELWGPHADRHRTSAALWKKPYQWNRAEFLECLDCGSRFSKILRSEKYCWECESENTVPARQRVFVSSLSDICETHPQITGDMRREIAKIVMDCENLDFLFLTKRPEEFNFLWTQHFGSPLPDNLWVGTTVENQKYADERIPALLKIPAKVRFLSCEPLLGHIGFNASPVLRDAFENKKIHWVIAGGESGSKARPMNPLWVRGLRDQCKDAGIAFHFKQWGENKPLHEEIADGHYLDLAEQTNMLRPGIFSYQGYVFEKVGKKNAGRLLDGVEHNEFPK